MEKFYLCCFLTRNGGVHLICDPFERRLGSHTEDTALIFNIGNSYPTEDSTLNLEEKCKHASPCTEATENFSILLEIEPSVCKTVSQTNRQSG